MEIVAYITTNAIAVIFLFLTWRSTMTGRILFFVLFILGSFINAYTVIQHPDAYQYFADTAWPDFYKSFIEGWFRNNVRWVIALIACSQFLISVSMWFKDSTFLKIGALGAIIFLICISPLGLGSAFPATLIFAAAMLIILKRANEPVEHNIGNTPA